MGDCLIFSPQVDSHTRGPASGIFITIYSLPMLEQCLPVGFDVAQGPRLNTSALFLCQAWALNLRKILSLISHLALYQGLLLRPIYETLQNTMSQDLHSVPGKKQNEGKSAVRAGMWTVVWEAGPEQGEGLGLCMGEGSGRWEMGEARGEFVQSP